MAIVLQSNEFSMQCTSTSVTVPNNDVARLMYYLHCVCTAIDCNHDSDIQRLTSYNNWSFLSMAEQKQLLVVCYIFSPDIFNKRVFFPSDELCGGSANKFYRINQVRHRLLAAESVVIAGRICEVHQIMTYKMSWMKTFYFDPMERLAGQLNTQRPAISNTRISNYTPTVVRQPIQSTSSSQCTPCRVCLILCCVLVIISIIIGIIIVRTTK